MKIWNVDGTPIDATFSIHAERDGRASLLFESSGGRAGGPNPRNLEYRAGLRTLLTRLKRLGATIEEIRVESSRTLRLPEAERRVTLKDYPTPLVLADVVDVDRLRKAISAGARRIGSASQRAGGSSRRMQFLLSGVEGSDEVESVLAGAGPDLASGPALYEGRVVDALVEARSVIGGQGFQAAVAARRTIEMHAMARAITHYEAMGYVVEDVSATSSYDLRCRGNDKEVHVEVKGTTTTGAWVLLTANEVAHARAQHPDCDLFVVSGIQVDAETLEISGPGTATVWEQWVVDDGRLDAIAYQFSPAATGRVLAEPST
jgi:hypothetical protein